MILSMNNIQLILIVLTILANSVHSAKEENGSKGGGLIKKIFGRSLSKSKAAYELPDDENQGTSGPPANMMPKGMPGSKGPPVEMNDMMKSMMRTSGRGGLKNKGNRRQPEDENEDDMTDAMRSMTNTRGRGGLKKKGNRRQPVKAVAESPEDENEEDENQEDINDVMERMMSASGRAGIMPKGMPGSGGLPANMMPKGMPGSKGPPAGIMPKGMPGSGGLPGPMNPMDMSGAMNPMDMARMNNMRGSSGSPAGMPPMGGTMGGARRPPGPSGPSAGIMPKGIPGSGGLPGAMNPMDMGAGMNNMRGLSGPPANMPPNMDMKGANMPPNMGMMGANMPPNMDMKGAGMNSMNLGGSSGPPAGMNHMNLGGSSGPTAGMNNINFDAMDHEEFVKACLKELTNANFITTGSGYDNLYNGPDLAKNGINIDKSNYDGNYGVTFPDSIALAYKLYLFIFYVDNSTTSNRSAYSPNKFCENYHNIRSCYISTWNNLYEIDNPQPQIYYGYNPYDYNAYNSGYFGYNIGH